MSDLMDEPEGFDDEPEDEEEEDDDLLAPQEKKGYGEDEGERGESFPE